MLDESQMHRRKGGTSSFGEGDDAPSVRRAEDEGEQGGDQEQGGSPHEHDVMILPAWTKQITPRCVHERMDAWMHA
jgi:hypothetical protein